MRLNFCFLLVLFVFGQNAFCEDIKLVTGEVLTGDVVEKTDESITMDHPSLGRIVIPIDQVAVGKEAPRINIKSRFEMGASGSNGNSKTFDYRAAFNSLYEGPRLRSKFDASYYNGTSDDELTRCEVTAGTINDFFLADSKRSFFVAARYNWNEFESWNSRVIFIAGLGLKIIDRDDLESFVRAGGGFIQEWGSDNEDIMPGWVLSSEMTWDIDERQKFSAESAYFPEYSKTDKYRITAKAHYSAIVDAANGVSIGMGVEDEYQSDVDPGFQKNDIKYFAMVTIAF